MKRAGWTMFAVLVLVVSGCGHDYITRPAPAPAPSDTTHVPCPDDEDDD